MSDSLPVVHVALATYNGQPWIRRQVETILGQEGVQVRLTVSDDGSTDGTREWVEALAKADDRVRLLPRRSGPSHVADNFFHALRRLDVQPGQFAAFADQDDLWQPHKLRDQVALLRSAEADAVSANVTAFAVKEDGSTHQALIRKDHPQVKWDFLFEAPGPGSTHLFSHRGWKTLVAYLDQWGCEGVAVHDWLDYVVLRAAGLKWVIDPRSHVAYRQHDRNVAGAHRGWAAVRTRYRLLRSGHYREQFLLMTEAARRAAQAAGRGPAFLAALDGWKGRLADESWKGRLAVAARARQMRRRPRDQVSLAAAALLRAW